MAADVATQNSFMNAPGTIISIQNVSHTKVQL